MKNAEIKASFKKLNNHFIKEILNGNFEVVKIDEHLINISIDGFSFCLWIANGREYLKTYNRDQGDNFIDLFFNQGEKKKAWPIFNKIIIKHKKEVVFKQKKAEYLKLRKELNL